MGKLEKKLEDVIKYDAKLNSIKLAEDIIKDSLGRLKEFGKNIPKDYLEIARVIKREVESSFDEHSVPGESLRDGSFLEKLYDGFSTPEGEQMVNNELHQITLNYMEQQFQITQAALLKDSFEKELNEFKGEVSKLEDIIGEGEKALSKKIINGHREHVVNESQGMYRVEDLNTQALQQTLKHYLQSSQISVASQTTLQYTLLTLMVKQRENVLNLAKEGLEKLGEEKVAKWMYDDISANIKSQGFGLKDLNETNMQQLMQQYAANPTNQSLIEYVVGTLNVGARGYKAEKDKVETERLRREELVPFFDEYLTDKKEKEMGLWDYAFNEILNGNGGIENYDKSTEEGMEKVQKIRERYVYEFIEKEAPEYFAEFVEKFHDLPHEENLGVVISNPTLSVENEELFPGGIIDQEYKNVSREFEKEYKKEEGQE